MKCATIEKKKKERVESKIAHETIDELTLPCHARTPSGCKSGDVKSNIILKYIK